MKFQFGNVVVVDEDKVGVIIKSWANLTYDVYVRSYGLIREYKEPNIKHFVYGKYIPESDLDFYT